MKQTNKINRMDDCLNVKLDKKEEAILHLQKVQSFLYTSCAWTIEVQELDEKISSIKDEIQNRYFIKFEKGMNGALFCKKANEVCKN